MRKVPLLVYLLLLFVFSVSAQNPNAPSPSAAYYPVDPMAKISDDVSKITFAVTGLTKQMKAFVDKFEKVGGITFNEKQQRLILGMELLTRAEARVAVLQKSQIELTEKLNESRAKLTQAEIDLRPRSIDRSVQYAGTTETDELRDARRTKLEREKTSLTQLVQQISGNLAETNDALREAQLLATRLRKLYLPQIEKEIYETIQ